MERGVEGVVEPWRSEESRGLFVGKGDREMGWEGRKNLFCVLALGDLLAACGGVVFV